MFLRDKLGGSLEAARIVAAPVAFEGAYPASTRDSILCASRRLVKELI
jgi:hypothetical protein